MTRDRADACLLPVSDEINELLLCPQLRPTISLQTAKNDTHRLSSPFRLFNTSHPSNSVSDTSTDLNPISFDNLPEEEEGTHFMGQQQQLEEENQTELTQLNQAFQGAKLIEEQILETIPEFKATDADEASQWLTGVESVFRKLNYQPLSWPLEASKRFQNESMNLWYAESHTVVHNDWEQFKQRLIEHVRDRVRVQSKSKSTQQQQPSSETFEYYRQKQQSTSADIREDFQKFSGVEDPELWVESINETFAEIRIPPNQRLDFIPSLLTKKALTDHVLRKLKSFGGKNENVILWLEDFELLVKSQRWSDDMKFKCVPTLLQDEAMKWYKRNSATITSWSEFEKQIKEEFTSRFKNRKAFERLLHYEQSMNQSIKDYYNEIMDLCKEADPQMSETIKLQYLLTKVKPTLKLEVSKQFPETPADFLNYGKQLEELMEFMKDDPTTVCVACAPQPSTSSRIHASINRNDQRSYVPPPRRFEQQQESNELHHLLVNRPVTPLPSSSQTPRNNPSQSSNAAANSQSNQTQHNLYYSRSAYPTSRPPPQNYSGCHSCGSLDHYQRACPKRQGFP
ncbi:unnamed protein product [Didymodactylos carnosus]|uniref:Retrotransposon gag domain-containing protein n=1 Tax=Didymodactylos carnosus TaxID=1234261 RepID=A0A8S2DDA5_9BILA|nr:unnamed protein product [Didymodactylos carnosus]CAF3690610.1 unnamed protein product [Didymodactylos carnosus]